MRVSVQKWGNSLALRVPKAVAVDAGLKQGSAVELSVRDGKLVVTPQRRVKYSLAELLRGVRPSRLHRESDFGAAVGRESW